MSLERTPAYIYDGDQIPRNDVARVESARQSQLDCRAWYVSITLEPNHTKYKNRLSNA